MSTGPKKSPFANAKPRDQWKKPVRRLFSTVVKAMDYAPTGESEPVLKLTRFTFQRDGLHVRVVGARRKSERTVPLEKLVNMAKEQPELFA
jgi:hypothetical protein